MKKVIPKGGRRKNSEGNKIRPDQDRTIQEDRARLGRLMELRDFSDAVQWIQQAYRDNQDPTWASRDAVVSIILREVVVAIESGDRRQFEAFGDIVHNEANRTPCSPVELALIEFKRITDMLAKDDPDHSLLSPWPPTAKRLQKWVMMQTQVEHSLDAIRKAAKRIGIKVRDGRGK